MKTKHINKKNIGLLCGSFLLAATLLAGCAQDDGNYDYLLKVRAKDMKQYQEFVLNKLGEIDSLASIESTFVMSEIKQTYGVHI